MTATVPNCAGSTRGGGWPTSRILFLLAGAVTLTSAVPTATVSSWFRLMTSAVVVNELLFVATGRCPASLVIERQRRRRPAATVHP